MHLFLHIIKDTISIMPFIFIIYLVIEYLEHKTNTAISHTLMKAGKMGTVYGALLGSIPQCGFSVIASDMFSRGAITVGTLVAIFIATSDEAVPIILSHPDMASVALKLIGLKIVFGVVFGLLTDVIWNKTHKINVCTVEEEHEHFHGNCESCEGGIHNGYFPTARGKYIKYLKFNKPSHYILDFDGVYMNMQVFLNENYLASHPYGYTPFLVDITPYTMENITNKLVVTTNPFPESSRWYSGNGIYRDVFLWEGGDIRIEPWDMFITTKSITKEDANIHFNYTISADRAANIRVRFSIISDGTEEYIISLIHTDSRVLCWMCKIKNNTCRQEKIQDEKLQNCGK